MKFPFYALNANNQIVAISETLEWARHYEKDERRLALTEICPDRPGLSEIMVSTVFLSITSFAMPPLLEEDNKTIRAVPGLFESMLFGGHEAVDQVFEKRYDSYEEAMDGHRKMVEDICAKLRLTDNQFRTYYPRQSKQQADAADAAWKRHNRTHQLPDRDVAGQLPEAD